MRSFNCDMYWLLLPTYSEHSGFGLGVFSIRGVVYQGEEIIPRTIWANPESILEGSAWHSKQLYKELQSMQYLAPMIEESGKAHNHEVQYLGPVVQCKAA